MHKDLDLLSVLSEAEQRDLKHNAEQRERRKADAVQQRRRERVQKLESLGLLEETTTDWVAVETVTFWRHHHCLCGASYEGPAYDANPTWVRLEKMIVRRFDPRRDEFVPLATPRPTKSRLSTYRRGDYCVNVPHRVEHQHSQLWSCPKCKTHAVTTQAMARPWTSGPPSQSQLLSDDAPPARGAPVQTFAELADAKRSHSELVEAYAELGLDLEGES